MGAVRGVGLNVVPAPTRGIRADTAQGICIPHCRCRKVRLTPFPPCGENYARSLAPPPPTGTASLAFLRGPRLAPQKENGPHPQGVCRIRKRQSRQRLRNARSKRKRRFRGERAFWVPGKSLPAAWIAQGVWRFRTPRVSFRLRCHVASAGPGEQALR